MTLSLRLVSTDDDGDDDEDDDDADDDYDDIGLIILSYKAPLTGQHCSPIICGYFGFTNQKQIPIFNNLTMTQTGLSSFNRRLNSFHFSFQFSILP